jgi:hypothetical protein
MALLRLPVRAGRKLGLLLLKVVRLAALAVAGMAAVFSLLVVLDVMLLGRARRPPRA